VRNLRTNERSLVLPDDVCQIINNEEWWGYVEELKNLMKPFARCLDKLQADKAQLHDVILSFGYFVQIYKNHHDQEFGACMINRIEKRWNSWEQTLLIISIFLHPTLKDTIFNDSIPNLTWVDLGRWVAYYYVVWFKKRPHNLLSEIENFRRKKFPFSEPYYSMLSNDVKKFWSYFSTHAKELGPVAIRLYGICTNSASVERLWSSMGFLHNIRRNKLKVFFILTFC